MNIHETRLLESLIKVVSQLRDQIHSVSENQKAYYDAEHERWNRPIRTETQLPEEISEHYRAENRDRPLKTWREWILLIVQGAGVLVALLYAIFTYRTLEEIRKQTPEIKRSAGAAESAASTARDSLIRSQRPWVGPEGVPQFAKPFTIDSDGTLHSELRLTLKNFGPSPALTVDVDAEFYIQPPGGDIAEFNRATERICRSAELSTSPIPPSTAARTGRYIFPNGIQIYQFNSGSRRGDTGPPKTGAAFDIIGCAVYSDQFNARELHHTRFCFFGNVPPASAIAQLTPCLVNQRVD